MKEPEPEAPKEPEPEPEAKKEEEEEKKKEPEEEEKPKIEKFGFLKHLKSQNLMESEPLLLECEIFGKEPLELIWLRNGKEIPDNPDFLKERIGTTYKLTVNEIFPEDSGVFSAELFCEAANLSILSSCSVVVKGKQIILTHLTIIL